MKVSNRTLLLCLVALFCSLSGRSEVAYSQDADWIADGAFFNFGSSWSTGVVPSGTAHFDRDAAYPVRFTADANLDTAEVSAGQVQFLLDPGALEVTTLKLNGPSGAELELARGRVDAVQVRIAPSPGDEASLRLSNGAELHVGPKDTIFGISGGLVLGPGAGSIELISGGSLVTAGTAIDSGAILLFEGGSWIDTEVLDLGAGGSSDPAVLYTRYGSSTILSSFNAGLQGVGANVIVEQDSVIKVLEDFQANDVKLSLKAGVIQVDGTLFYGPKLNLTLFDGMLDVGALRRMPDANRLPTFPSGRIRVRGDLSVSDYGRAVANDETLQVDGALRVGPTEIFHLGNGKLIAGSLSGRGHFDFTSSNQGQLEVGQLRLGLNAGEPTTY